MIEKPSILVKLSSGSFSDIILLILESFEIVLDLKKEILNYK